MRNSRQQLIQEVKELTRRVEALEEHNEKAWLVRDEQGEHKMARLGVGRIIVAILNYLGVEICAEKKIAYEKLFLKSKKGEA